VPLKTVSTSEQANLPGSEFRRNPLQHLRWLYTRFVQGLFWYCPKGQYHWEPSLDDTEIVVTNEHPVQIETLGSRPCVTFSRAPLQFFSIGIGDMLAYNMQTGATRKTVLIPGTMVINVSSKNMIEADNLAFFVAEHLWLLRDMLMQEGFYDVGRNIGIGPPTPPG
jgi:hypothetical protein